MTDPEPSAALILEVGRVAADRAEVFAPGAPIFPSQGVELLRGHRGESVMTFDPIVEGSKIRIDARLPDNELGRQVATEVRSGARSALSVEFVPRGGSARVWHSRTEIGARPSLRARRGRFLLTSARRSPRAGESEVSPVMAMITKDELRVILGADHALIPRVDSIHKAACTRVKRYAKNAPTEIKNEALILFAAWIYQASAQSRRVFPNDNEGPPINASRGFLLSGAQGLLAPWHRPRAGVCR